MPKIMPMQNEINLTTSYQQASDHLLEAKEFEVKRIESGEEMKLPYSEVHEGSKNFYQETIIKPIIPVTEGTFFLEETTALAGSRAATEKLAVSFQAENLGLAPILVSTARAEGNPKLIVEGPFVTDAPLDLSSGSLEGSIKLMLFPEFFEPITPSMMSIIFPTSEELITMAPSITITSTPQAVEPSVPETPPTTPPEEPTPILLNADFQSITGREDSSIHLNIDTPLLTLGTISTISLFGIPDSTSLSAGHLNPDKSWTLTAEELLGLTITPHEDTDFVLAIRALGENEEGDQLAIQGELSVLVKPAVIEPIPVFVPFGNVNGYEGIAITLNLVNTLPFMNTLSEIKISGAPETVQFSAGSHGSDGSWTLSTDDLIGLKITPSDDNDFTLHIVATAQDIFGNSLAIQGDLPVIVAETPVPQPSNLSLSLPSVRGFENNGIALNLDDALSFLNTISTVTIAGVPSSATLSAGSKNPDGTWTVTTEQLRGLTIKPTNANDFTLQVAAFGSGIEGGSINVQSNLSVIVDPTILTSPASTVLFPTITGIEGSSISLGIDSVIEAAAGKANYTQVTIYGIPDSAFLSEGTHHADGSWTVPRPMVNNLTIHLGNESDFVLQITAKITGKDGFILEGELLVIADPNLNHPSPETFTLTMTASELTGFEDTAIPLELHDALGSIGTVSSVTLMNVPESASFSAGIHHADGTWTLTGEDLIGLTLTPTESVDFNLQISATAQDLQGNTLLIQGELPISIEPVLAEPNQPIFVPLSLGSVMGFEDSAFALNLDSALPFADSISHVSILGLPESASLSAGTQLADGSWSVTGEELDGLKITTTTDSDFNLEVLATATDMQGNTLLLQGELPIIVETALPPEGPFGSDQFSAFRFWVPGEEQGSGQESVDQLTHLLESETSPMDWFTITQINSSETASSHVSEETDWTKEVEHPKTEPLTPPSEETPPAPAPTSSDDVATTVDQNNDLNKT